MKEILKKSQVPGRRHRRTSWRSRPTFVGSSRTGWAISRRRSGPILCRRHRTISGRRTRILGRGSWPILDRRSRSILCRRSGPATTRRCSIFILCGRLWSVFHRGRLRIVNSWRGIAGRAWAILARGLWVIVHVRRLWMIVHGWRFRAILCWGLWAVAVRWRLIVQVYVIPWRWEGTIGALILNGSAGFFYFSCRRGWLLRVSCRRGAL